MKQTLIRLTFEILVSLIVAAGLIAIMISAAFASSYATHVVTTNLHILGLQFYQITRSATGLTGRTLTAGMSSLWLGSSVILLGLFELRHKLIP